MKLDSAHTDSTKEQRAMSEAIIATNLYAVLSAVDGGRKHRGWPG